MDVTSQYVDTTDVQVRLEQPIPEGARYAYICVFNTGEWKAIHWGRIQDNKVIFTKMGRNIAYLAAYYVDGELVPAAPPFILTKEGIIESLKGIDDPAEVITIEISVTRPETPDADTRRDHPVIHVKPGKSYELFCWDGEWRSMGKKRAQDKAIFFESVPRGRLLWLVEEGSRRLERIFTIEDGKQAWW